jgi:hypothetical protein
MMTTELRPDQLADMTRDTVRLNTTYTTETMPTEARELHADDLDGISGAGPRADGIELLSYSFGVSMPVTVSR